MTSQIFPARLKKDTALPFAFVVLAVFLSGVALQAFGWQLDEAQIGASLIGLLAYALRNKVAVWLMTSKLRLDWPKNLLPRTPLGALTYVVLTIASVVVLSTSAPNIQAAVLNERLRIVLRRDSGDKLDPTRSAKEIVSVISAAKKNNVQLNPEIVRTASERLTAAPTSGDSWKAALFVASFASTLHNSSSISEAMATVANSQPLYYLGFGNDPAVAPKVTFVGEVPESRASIVWKFGQPDPNAGSDTGPEYQIQRGGRVTLDGVQVKQVTFVGSFVRYSGGPLELRNVYFKDCTFDVVPTPLGKKLLRSMIGPEGANFLSTDQ